MNFSKRKKKHILTYILKIVNDFSIILTQLRGDSFL